MQEMRKIFYDNSILTRIAWKKDGATQEETQNRWNRFVDQMDTIYPGYSQENFRWIHSSTNNLEIIGLGKIRKDKKIKCSIFENKEFTPLRLLVDERELLQSSDTPELFLETVVDRINKFIRKELSPRNIYRQTIKFQRLFPSHQESHFIMAGIKDWAKKINSKQEYYDYFLRDFFWDSVFRYPFINIQKTAKSDKLDVMKHWGAVLGILFREYYHVYSQDLSLECSALGLFAEIDRVGSSCNGISNERAYNEILGRWDDMGDADTIHYALIGKRLSLESNEQVIVVTGDKRKDVESRLECLYINMQWLAAKGFNIITCPGTVIFFSPETMTYNGKLDVRDFVKNLDPANKIS